MKKSIQVFLSFLIVSCILIGNALYVFPVLASDEIPITEFGDVKFFNAAIAEVNNKLNLDDPNRDNKLLYSEAASLTKLVAYSENISSIKGIKYFTGLTQLNMNNNKIVDIEELSFLNKLKIINFGGNQITSLNAISDITLLTSINFAFNNISNIDELSSLVNLKTIYLDNNNITSLDSIRNLTFLTYINLSINKITSLFGFPNVSGATINLSYNRIDFDSPLNNPIYNQIRASNSIDISNQDLVLPTDNDEILNNMDGIVDANLYIEARLQADINKDGKLTRGEARALQDLDAKQCDIASMKGIEFFTGLSVLNLSYNRISVIQGLDGRHSMYKIDLSHNRIDIVANDSIIDILSDNNISVNFGYQDPDFPEDNDVILNDESGIPDTFFYNLVLTASNDGVILTRGKARRITELFGQNKGINRIKGLEYLLGLTTLDLSYNKISSLVGFENLVGCNILLNNNNIDMSKIININIKLLLESRNTIDFGNQIILKYYINPINNYVHGVELNTTIELFDTEIRGAGIGSVDYSRTNIARGSTIVTGSKITIIVNGNYLELTVIVYGDLTGDGKIDLNDLVLIRDSLLEKSQLTDINKSAGDIYGEGSITLNDLLWVSDYISI